MEDILLVDGYNVLFSWPELSKLAKVSIEDARSRLLDILQDYQGYKGDRIIVVFDAHHVRGGQGAQENHGTILVIYTGEGVTADSLIEKLTPRYVKQGKVYVVTSDWDQQKVVFGQGAFRIPARELLEMVRGEKNRVLEKIRPRTIQRKELAAYLDEEIRQELEKMRKKR